MKKETIRQDQTELKEKLCLLRDKKKLNNNEIANITGCSESTISELVRDKRSFSPKLLALISTRLGDYMNENKLVDCVEQYRKMWQIAKAGKQASDMRLVGGNAGIGKSSVFRKFAEETPGCYYFKVDRKYTWNKFLLEINRVMGCEVTKKSTSALQDNIVRKVEKEIDNYPVLIIDESEVLPNLIFREIKNLFTTTEDKLCILIVGITEVIARIARLAGLDPVTWIPVKADHNRYTTFARRVKVFRINNISYGDIENFCKAKGITNRKVIEMAARKWWNYGEANRAIERAVRMNINLATITEEEFNIL